MRASGAPMRLYAKQPDSVDLRLERAFAVTDNTLRVLTGSPDVASSAGRRARRLHLTLVSGWTTRD